MKKLIIIALLVLIGVGFSATMHINSIAQEKPKTETLDKQPEHHRPDHFRGERMRGPKHHKGGRDMMMKMHENFKEILSEEELAKFDSLANGMKALWKERKELHDEMDALRGEMRDVLEPHKDEIKELMQKKHQERK